MSYLQKQSARIYNNHVESLKEAGDWKKNLQENLDNITGELYSFKKNAILSRFEQGYPT